MTLTISVKNLVLIQLIPFEQKQWLWKISHVELQAITLNISDKPTTDMHIDNFLFDIQISESYICIK